MDIVIFSRNFQVGPTEAAGGGSSGVLFVLAGDKHDHYCPPHLDCTPLRQITLQMANYTVQILPVFPSAHFCN